MADPRVDPTDPGAAPDDAIQRYTARDDVIGSIGGWPVEVDLRDERFRSFAHRLQYALRAAQGGALALPGPLREGVVRGVAGLGKTSTRATPRRPGVHRRRAPTRSGEVERPRGRAGATSCASPS